MLILEREDEWGEFEEWGCSSLNKAISLMEVL